MTTDQLLKVFDLLRSEAEHDWINLSDIQEALETVLGEHVWATTDGLDAVLEVVTKMLESGAYRSIAMDASSVGGRTILSESAQDTVDRIRSECLAESLIDNSFVGLFEFVKPNDVRTAANFEGL